MDVWHDNVSALVVTVSETAALVWCIGLSLGDEWENGCRWRWVGRGRGRQRGRPPTFDVEATVHRHDRAQEDGNAFWLSGEGGGK